MKPKALEMFNSVEGGISILDLYVFCANVNYDTNRRDRQSRTSRKRLAQQNIRAAQNSTGERFGAEMYAAI